MELSSPRFKALAVTAGFCFWFAIITVGIGAFSFELLGIFAVITIAVTQIFSVKHAGSDKSARTRLVTPVCHWVKGNYK